MIKGKYNLKKLFFILLFSLFCVVGFTTEYAHYGYSVKCARCVELHQKDPGLSIQIAWRSYDYKTENGKTYAIYKCAGGHKYWAELK